jgi:hexosaminidase
MLIFLVARPIAVEARMPLGMRDEAYSLSVPADGSPAVLSANSTLGLFRGLNAFSQLWFTVQRTVYMLGAPVDIQDSPAYVRSRGPVVFYACLLTLERTQPYRGFMLDTARNLYVA